MTNEINIVSITADNGVAYDEKWVNVDLEEIKKEPVLCHGWASKGKPSNPHFGLSKGWQLALAKKCPNLVLYTVGSVPVLDPAATVELIFDTVRTSLDLDIQKIATSRSKGAAQQKIEGIKNALTGLTPELLEALKAQGFDPATL